MSPRGSPWGCPCVPVRAGRGFPWDDLVGDTQLDLVSLSGGWAAVRVHLLRRDQAPASIPQWALGREPAPRTPTLGKGLLLEWTLTVRPTGPRAGGLSSGWEQQRFRGRLGEVFERPRGRRPQGPDSPKRQCAPGGSGSALIF